MHTNQINFKRFFISFLLRSELISFGIIIPLAIISIYYGMEIPLEIIKKFFFAIVLILILFLIYTIISLIFFLKPIQKLFLYMEEKIPILHEKSKILSQLVQLPFLRSIDIFFRVLIFGIIFGVFLGFYLKLSFYKLLVYGVFVAITASSCGIIYFFLLEILINKILSISNFRKKFFFSDFDEVKFLKFKYFWTYLLFLSFLLITSISGAVSDLYMQFWSKKTYREIMSQKLVLLKERLNSIVYNIEEDELLQIKKEVDIEPLQKKFIINKISKLGGTDYALFNKSTNEWIYKLKIDLRKDQFKQGLNFYDGSLLFVSESEKYIQFIEISKIEFNRFLKWNLKESEELLVVDQNQNVVFSTNLDLENKSLNDLTYKNKENVYGFDFYESIYFNNNFYELFTLNISENLSLGIFYLKSIYQDPISFNLIILSIVFIILTIFSSIATILYLSGKIQHLEKIIQSLQSLSNGFIKNQEFTLGIDEFSVFDLTIRKLQDKLQEIIKYTFDLLEKVYSTTSDFTKQTEDLVQDSENEAASAEQISATTEEISSSIDRISDFTLEQTNLISNLSNGITNLTNVIKEAQSNLKEIREIINESEKIKTTTEEKIQKMIESIHRIQSTSDQITSIVGIVKEIADQINLLSLNASIEAARAGEYGKGFAVVAEEISKLSDKTMNSIKNIHTLIKNSNEQVKQGIKITNQVKNTFEELIKEILKINQLSTKVAEVIIKQEFVNTGVLAQMTSVEHKSKEINSNVSEQKLAIREITTSLNAINNHIMNSTEKTKFINKEAFQLLKEVEELKTHLRFFKIEQIENSTSREAKT